MTEGFDVDGVARQLPASTDEILGGGEADAHARERRPVLPEADAAIDPSEAQQLVEAFRRVRDRYRGRYVAPVDELPDRPDRIASAYFTLAGASSMEIRRHQLEDLVDLQAFVDDPPAVLAPPRVSSEKGVTSPADPLIEAIRWRQAGIIAWAMNHPSTLGDHTAIRSRWTAIGEARAAIDLVNRYREEQTLGLGATALWLVAAPAGYVIAILLGLARPTIVALVILAIGWFASPAVGAAAGWFEWRVLRSTWMRTHPAVSEPLEVAVGFGLIAGVPFVAGIVVATIVSNLGWP
jgi:hypothetical protein